jgi:3-methyl-2-oxobutanoate hydroxymethyltransferase
VNILDFKSMKREGRKITVVTAYDYTLARIVEQSEVDCVLVGDSCAMVMHGFPSTVHATVEMMEAHVAAVARGLKQKFLIGDLPFLSYRKGTDAALSAVGALMRAGAHAVKLEGVWGHEEVVHRIVGSGVPVMGHIGLTPQSIHGLGGFRVQGKDEASARDLLAQARKLEDLGCFSIVLECVPAALAQEITAALSIPTIGIGAGSKVDGQVLVLQDLLGMSGEFKPKFLRHFADGHGAVLGGLNSFQKEVLSGTYPMESEIYL